ncbi:unnamed protein product [Adineta ricciae]|uniref:Uncharacterized protein n=1 Tax=Adineta ricciae TaxID=249248 RepID=A0A813Q683_ADIRI|nr:unnamed protein product [Adineta ricciae]CAF1500509.1 unnamed protein product [Adineta ricciae]
MKLEVAAGTGIAESALNEPIGPHGIFDSAHLNLYVTDCNNNRVSLFEFGHSGGIVIAGKESNSSNYYYEAIRLTVFENDYYGSTGRGNVGTFGDVYIDKFEPINPFKNLLEQNYRSCDAHINSNIVSYLESGVTYVLVVTTFLPNLTGNFSILVTGPNNVTLYRFNKCIYHSSSHLIFV